MAVLMLEDGTVFEGEWFGAKHSIIGEVVFNTGMTGYQQVLTDPSYYGQIVTMTYPLIGNNGINLYEAQPHKPQLKALIIRELSDIPSSSDSSVRLCDYLEKNNICGLHGVDTRALTRIIRDRSITRGCISDKYPAQELIEKMRSYKPENAIPYITCKQRYDIDGNGPHIAVLDFGMNKNITESLKKRGCRMTVFPAYSTKDEILSCNPDGILLSNGPGDPKSNPEIINTISSLLGTRPIFGICLGHLLLALAAGGDTYRLDNCHRGCNQPVKDIIKDRVYITAQNHNYAIYQDKLPKDSAITHINWNDRTIEGIRYNSFSAFSVQFHPQGYPGPTDTAYIFDEFLEMI